MTTWFGGTFCVESALRRKPMTTTMRTNDVVIMRMLGASDRIVRSAMIWIVTDTSCGPDAVPTLRFTLGTAGAALATPPPTASAAARAAPAMPKSIFFPLKLPNSILMTCGTAKRSPRALRAAT